MKAAHPPLQLVAGSPERVPEVKPARRIDALATLPVFLKLGGRRVIVAGGSEAALWKAELLAAAGAHIEVFAGEKSEIFQALVDDPPAGTVKLLARDWQDGDLAGAALAIADVETEAEATRFAAAARKAGVPFNIVDKPDFCDIQFGAIVNRSPLIVSISTDGAAPVFGQAIRAKIEGLLPEGFRHWAEAARDWRPDLRKLGLSFARRRRFWERFSERALAEPGRQPEAALRDRLIKDAADLLGAGTEKGRVTLVGAGPGDPDLLTLKAVRALQSAEIILYDDLVAPQVLDFARREAKRILVGKTGHGPACKQEEINALMLRLARQGKHVVRLKSGDPGIFGRASEEIEACRQAGIEVSIVPGITAAQGAAASLGISLTQRQHSRRLQFVTGHAKDGKLPADLDWRAIADPSATTALYMPKRTLAEFRDRAIEAGLLPHTPAAAISSATRHDERRLFATISGLPELVARFDPDGPLLILIGRGLETEAASEPGRAADAPQRPFAAGSGT
ncbi:uroporphyrin-III C-methyltransferase / precorrin-2 dehydrogenase / sirohydrochlorin ferrochelatase [Rhizobiales bacterium GAS113]|nr:uroporphyrin-III C-methyltransferase / precorrin-2 dehydrogenase / sirohydrochlorin ferrochelatase [Rhizobiales bacterium GAS113]